VIINNIIRNGFDVPDSRCGGGYCGGGEYWGGGGGVGRPNPALNGGVP
jgi:hypothetical protein